MHILRCQAVWVDSMNLCECTARTNGLFCNRHFSLYDLNGFRVLTNHDIHHVSVANNSVIHRISDIVMMQVRKNERRVLVGPPKTK